MSDKSQNPENEELIKGYHSELLAFLKAHLSSASQDDSIPTDTVGFLMTKIRAVLAKCIQDLEEAGDGRFGDAELGQRIKEAVAKLTGWAFGALSGAGSHGTSKMLRDEYMFLNATSIGYTLLYTTERGANGETRFAQLLFDHLKLWNQLIVNFNRSMPGVVLAELAQEEGGFDQSKAIRITESLQATWRSERTSASDLEVSDGAET